MDQPNIESSLLQLTRETKPAEGITQKVQEWTEKGRSLLVKLIRKVDDKPREVIEAVAEVQAQNGLTREAKQYKPEVINAAGELITLGVSEVVRDYLQKYGRDCVTNLLELAKQNLSVLNRIIELGIPPQFAERVCIFESFLSQPKKEGYDFSTHALRPEHYLKMIEVAEKKGAAVGFQLRSRAENLLDDIDAKAYSMGGAYALSANSGTGQPEEQGLPYTSFNRGSVATGYGDLAWVGPHDILFRSPDSGISYRNRAGTGEINVYTRKGQLIKILQTIDKYQHDPSQTQLVTDAINTYRDLRENSEFKGDVDGVRQMIAEDIKREPIQGIDLLNPFTVCLVPAEKAEVIKARLESAKLPDSIKSLLQSQLVVYEGDGRNIYQAYADFVRNPQVYVDKVVQSSQYTDHPLTVQEAIGIINLRDTLGSSTRVIDSHRFTRMSDLPLPESSSNGINGYLELALHDRLQLLPEWGFLGQLPREADVLLMPVFNNVIKSAIETVGKDFDTEVGRDKVFGILRDIAIDSTKPLAKMELGRRSQIISFFDLNYDVVDMSQSAYNQWYRKMFPFKTGESIKGTNVK